MTGVFTPERLRMLDEYFAIKIDENGNLCSLPQILPDYTPELDLLPLFFLRLAQV
jgi:DNA mismatch repair protein MLH1